MLQQSKHYHMHIRVPELGLEIYPGQKNFRADKMIEEYATSSWAFIVGTALLSIEHLPVKKAEMISNNSYLPSLQGWFIIGIQKQDAATIAAQQGLNTFIYGEKNQMPQIILLAGKDL